MSKTSPSALWFAPPIVVIAAFFASLPWLADIDETVTLSITAAAAIFVVVWARFVATRLERTLDEVELAGQRFAQAKGAAGGTFVTVLLLLPTPVVDWVTDNLILMTTGLGENTVHVGMVFGMVLLVVMQTLGTVVANAIWNRRIGGNA
jgi:hypothetical protein